MRGLFATALLLGTGAMTSASAAEPPLSSPAGKVVQEVNLEPTPGEVRPMVPGAWTEGAHFMVATHVHSYKFRGDTIQGSTATVGLTVGLGNVIAASLARETANGTLAIGAHLFRNMGIRLWRGDIFVALLFPSVYWTYLTSEDFRAVVMSTSLTGLRFAYSARYPWAPYLDIRLPRSDLWLPIRAAGGDLPTSDLLTATSWGVSVELGVLRF